MLIREFCLEEDYAATIALWQACNILLSKSDSRESIKKILDRDADLFLVVEQDQTIIGAVMGRYDGRRGWVQHLAIAPDFQGQRLGSQLVQELERRLQAKGCEKVNLLVRPDNASVQSFYQQLGFRRDELIYMEKWL